MLGRITLSIRHLKISSRHRTSTPWQKHWTRILQATVSPATLRICPLVSTGQWSLEWYIKPKIIIKRSRLSYFLLLSLGAVYFSLLLRTWFEIFLASRKSCSIISLATTSDYYQCGPWLLVSYRRDFHPAWVCDIPPAVGILSCVALIQWLNAAIYTGKDQMRIFREHTMQQEVLQLRRGHPLHHLPIIQILMTPLVMPSPCNNLI